MTNTDLQTLRTIAAEAATSRLGAALIPSFMQPAARRLINLGLLGIQAAPLKGSELYCYPSAAGRAAL